MKTKKALMNHARNALLSLLLLPLAAATNHAQSAIFPIATNLNATILAEQGGFAAFDGTHFLVGIQQRVIDQQFGYTNSPVGFQMISTNGSLVGSFTDFGRSGGLPWAACSGSNYLVVWQDDANYPKDCIYGQIVSPAGTLVGGAFPISSAPSESVDLMGPQVVAYAQSKYLVVWDNYQTNSSVYGQIVSADGSLIGGNLDIFPSTDYQDEVSAAIASDGTNFLVTCPYNSTAGGNHHINMGRFISPNGVMSPAFNIGQTISLDQNPQGLIFNGTNYLVIWPFDSETNSSGDPIWSLRGRFVNPDGTFPGNEFEVLGTNAPAMLPILAFDGANYLLSWTEGMFTPNSMVRMQFLDASGHPFGASFTPFTSVHGKPPMYGGAGFANGKYLALTTVGTGLEASGAGEVYGTFISSSVAPPQAAGSMSYANNHFTFSLSCTPGIPYVIQVTTNLASPVWSPLATNVFTNGVIDFTDSNAPGHGRFYQAVKN